VSYVVLHVADFSLQAVVRTRADPGGKPVALLDDHVKRAIVVQADARARTAGVTAGLTATQAMARCADLVLLPRSQAAENDAEAALLTVAWSISPRVERTAAGICTIDLAGKAPATHLPHGRAAVEQLRLFGLEATAGVARTPFLALTAARVAQLALNVGAQARCARSEGRDKIAPLQVTPFLGLIAVQDERGFLSPLPLSLIDPAPDLAAILDGWGIHTLGALTALPKPEVGRLLGQAGIELWERAAGETDQPIEPCVQAPTFAAAMELEHEVETLEPLLFVLRRFVDRLALQLANAGVVAAELALELTLADETAYQRGFRLPEPTGSPDILFRALQTHLETLHTASAIKGVRLVITPTRPLVRQHGLFDTGLRDPHGFAETLARVAAVVGRDRVGTPALEPTHRPDAFFLEKPVDVVGPLPPPSILLPLGLPLRRFRPPVEAQVVTGPLARIVPSAAEAAVSTDSRPRAHQGATNGGGRCAVSAISLGPASVRSCVVQGEVVQRRGPWRCSGEWWKPERWAGEEWDIELARGGLFRLSLRDGQWWVEGMYD
jgi:protein ImuB